MQQRLTAVVGEDSYLVREGLVAVLMDGGIEVLSVAGDLDELRDAVERDRPDVVVTDIRMPPTGTDEGIRIARELAESHPEIGVVVLSQHARAAYATEVFAAGNPRRAYLLKERLVLTTRAVEHHINSIFEKLDLHDPKTNRRVMATLVYTHGRD